METSEFVTGDELRAMLKAHGVSEKEFLFAVQNGLMPMYAKDGTRVIPIQKKETKQ